MNQAERYILARIHDDTAGSAWVSSALLPFASVLEIEGYVQRIDEAWANHDARFILAVRFKITETGKEALRA